MTMSKKTLENYFSILVPDDDRAERMRDIRVAGFKFAEAIVDNCPDSADRTYAIRMVRTAVMYAVQSITMDASEVKR